jgi:hypothetical protein
MFFSPVQFVLSAFGTSLIESGWNPKRRIFDPGDLIHLGLGPTALLLVRGAREAGTMDSFLIRPPAFLPGKFVWYRFGRWNPQPYFRERSGSIPLAHRHLLPPTKKWRYPLSHIEQF